MAKKKAKKLGFRKSLAGAPAPMGAEMGGMTPAMPTGQKKMARKVAGRKRAKRSY